MRKYADIPGFDISKLKHPSMKKFVSDMYIKLAEAGFDVRFTKGKSVSADGYPVSGYFTDEPSRELVVAAGASPRVWFPVMLHELCHFDQWYSNCKAWRDTAIDGNDCGYMFDSWVGGSRRRHSASTLCDIVRRIRNCELDCERRAIGRIREYGMPINIERYAQRANSYVMFYTYALIRRTWCKRGKPPYRIPAIINMMPHYIMPNEAYENISPELVFAYDQHCAPKKVRVKL